MLKHRRKKAEPAAEVASEKRAIYYRMRGVKGVRPTFRKCNFPERFASELRNPDLTEWEFCLSLLARSHGNSDQ